MFEGIFFSFFFFFPIPGNLKTDAIVVGIHSCLIKALGMIDLSLSYESAASFSAVLLAGAKDQRSDENQKSKSEKEGVFI